jgi:LPXTG-site transpeptidase (sortase) family protein
MTSSHRAPRRTILGLVLGVALAVAACGGADREGERAATRSPSASTSTSTTATTTTTPPTTEPAAEPPEMPRGTPARIVIPAANVDAPVVDLNKNPDGTLQVPDWQDTGWWERGPEPGERGPAVIVGHVDSTAGPAVFADLDQLEPGDRIDIELDDHRTTSYTVARSEQFPKDAFPTRDVYELTPGPELRLITCDGEFDDSTGHYVDNLVVFATPV